MPYFVIHNFEGETGVDQISKQELIERLKNNDSSYYGQEGFLEEIKDPDTNYWGRNLLIIKGEIIMPKPIEVVNEYEV